jgi:Bifunctional DNA primase/polymerase, N-terminal
MSRAFAEWQPQYAEQVVATFPVKDKKPCVRGWQSVGLNGSSQLALKFPEAEAFGFQCGKHSGITVVDIDCPEERAVEEAIRVFGRSPVLWRTGSGNFAMPFRFNGEKRRIRPIADLPIDVLGSGGYAVAPPSAGRKGLYQFLEGGLDHFLRLPTLHLPANENRPATDKIPIGKRADVLFHHALDQARYMDSLDDLIDVVRTRNLDCEQPLSDMPLVRPGTFASP